MNRLRAGALALLLVVFAAGMAVGWGVRNWRPAGPAPRYREARAMVDFLTKQLSLSPAQQDSVRGILRRHRPELDTLWHLVHPRMDSLRAVMHREINAQLTPSQQARYSALVARVERPAQPDSGNPGLERD
ncbi:MAG TPA: periplasmic heavy metal sensor [Gemmatimonadales bacterium]|nr:periplasmic heavy metal sensor [Gemmatimonadales bacterium]